MLRIKVWSEDLLNMRIGLLAKECIKIHVLRHHKSINAMLIINYWDNYPIQQHFRRNDKVVHEDRIIGYLSAVLNKKSYSYI